MYIVEYTIVLKVQYDHWGVCSLSAECWLECYRWLCEYCSYLKYHYGIYRIIIIFQITFLQETESPHDDTDSSGYSSSSSKKRLEVYLCFYWHLLMYEIYCLLCRTAGAVEYCDLVRMVTFRTPHVGTNNWQRLKNCQNSYEWVHACICVLPQPTTLAHILSVC